MKIDQVLVHYLLRTKHLALQGIGTFDLEAAFTDNSDPDKPIIIPADGIRFHYDPKVTEDDELVNFIVLHTKKIKPLASSDLDSFLSLGRQFLNIGKPFNLPGMGTLEKLNSGVLEFTGGQLIAPKMEPQKVKIEDAGAEDHDENMFNDYQQEHKGGTGKKALLIILTLLILGGIAWAVWHFMFNKNNNPENIATTTDNVVPIVDSSLKKDSVAIYAPLVDSSKISKNINKKNTTDSFTFKVVVNEFPNKQAALKRFANLKEWGRKVILYTNDSVTYKIAEPFMRPLSDTTKVLDSLNDYYSKAKTHLEY